MKSIMQRMMYSCRKASELSSLSLDQRLPLVQRVRHGLHLGMCKGCAAFNRQIRLLGDAAKLPPSVDEEGGTSSR